MNNIAISTNMIIIGNKTRNHDKLGTPALQIKLRIHVQRRTYPSLIKKMSVVFETPQLYSPKQYMSVFP